MGRKCEFNRFFEKELCVINCHDPQITIAIQKVGYSDQRIKKLLGLNWLG
ncbi:MAG TPA: hypothetical protein VF490_22480 [Chryseosolibacter sp.]